jgi:hypothetical protein
MDTGELDRTDRILLGACAAVWLGALGAGVAATVALVDLGPARAVHGRVGHPWLLYAVIAISAAVIIGAVPLLLRARRAALEESPPPAARHAVRAVRARSRRFAAPTRPPRSCGARHGCGRAAAPGYPRREPITHAPRPVMRRWTGCGCAAPWSSRSPWVSRRWPSVSPPI